MVSRVNLSGVQSNFHVDFSFRLWAKLHVLASDLVTDGSLRLTADVAFHYPFLCSPINPICLCKVICSWGYRVNNCLMLRQSFGLDTETAFSHFRQCLQIAAVEIKSLNCSWRELILTEPILCSLKPLSGTMWTCSWICCKRTTTSTAWTRGDGRLCTQPPYPATQSVFKCWSTLERTSINSAVSGATTKLRCICVPSLAICPTSKPFSTPMPHLPSKT